VRRIEQLLKSGHAAEALVTSVFTLEKTLRRSLKLAVLARGFSLKQADRLVASKGFKELREHWDIFEKSHRGLPAFIGNADWQFVPEAFSMRNNLVHGHKVYKLTDSEDYAKRVLRALKRLHANVKKDFGKDPWVRISGRIKPKLQWMT
jgi:hypothetical protein